MDSLVPYFSGNIGTDKVWTVILCLAIYCVAKKQPFQVFTDFAERREREHELAKALLDSGKLGKQANGFLREQLERIAFQRYCGIDADAVMRNALLKFHRAHQREIGWRELRQAYPNIRLSGAKLTANLGLVDHGLRWLVTALSALAGAFALFIMGYATFALALEQQRIFFALTAAAFMPLTASVLFSSANAPYHSTRKVISLCAKRDG